ncbi:MAG TPA: hypothetical protein PLU50_05585, partial [Pseudobdellovibrionaceae bacterium]|nr:hypothetical protein [Pseudobdellovibrionaceae bacterium]
RGNIALACLFSLSIALVSCGNKNTSAASPQPTPPPIGWNQGGTEAPFPGAMPTQTPIQGPIALPPNQPANPPANQPPGQYIVVPLQSPFYDDCGNRIGGIPGAVAVSPCQLQVVSNCCYSVVVNCSNTQFSRCRQVSQPTTQVVARTTRVTTTSTITRETDCGSETRCCETSTRCCESSTRCCESSSTDCKKESTTTTESPSSEPSKEERHKGIALCKSGSTTLSSLFETNRQPRTNPSLPVHKMIHRATVQMVKVGQGQTRVLVEVDATLREGVKQGPLKRNYRYDKTHSIEKLSSMSLDPDLSSEYKDLTLDCNSWTGDYCTSAHLRFTLRERAVDVYAKMAELCAIAPLDEVGNSNGQAGDPTSYTSFVQALTAVFADPGKQGKWYIDRGVVSTFTVVGGAQGLRLHLRTNEVDQKKYRFLAEKVGALISVPDIASPQMIRLNESNEANSFFTGKNMVSNTDLELGDLSSKQFTLRVQDPDSANNSIRLKLGVK